MTTDLDLYERYGEGHRFLRAHVVKKSSIARCVDCDRLHSEAWKFFCTAEPADPVPEWAYVLVSDLVRCYTLSSVLREIIESADVPIAERQLVGRTLHAWTTRLQARLHRARGNDEEADELLEELSATPSTPLQTADGRLQFPTTQYSQTGQRGREVRYTGRSGVLVTVDLDAYQLIHRSDLGDVYAKSGSIDATTGIAWPG